MCKKVILSISLVWLLAAAGSAFSALPERADWVGNPWDPHYGYPDEVELNWYTPWAWDPEGPPTCQARIHRDRTPSGPYWGPLIDSDVNIGCDDSDFRPSVLFSGPGTGEQVWRIVGGTFNILDRIRVSHNCDSIPATLIIEGNAVVNSLSGSSNSFRTGDKGGRPTILIRGNSVFHVYGGWRAGDSACEDSWVYVEICGNATVTVDEYLRLGDDGVGEFHFCGNAHVQISDWVGYNGRGGRDFGDMTISDNVEIWVGYDFQVIGQKVDANCYMSGGSINCRNFRVAGGYDAHGRLFMTDGLIVCRDELQCPAGDAQADIQLDGGTIECKELVLPAGGHIDITGGKLVIDGDKLDQIWELVCVHGRITGYRSCAGVVSTYNPDEDKTIVTATPHYIPGAAYCGKPPNGALVRCGSGVCLYWRGTSGVRDMHAVYFSSDYECVENMDPNCLLGLLPASRPPEWCIGPEELQLWTTYYWRIVEIYYPGLPVAGPILSFTCGCKPVPGDFNRDCIVNFKDWAILAESWGKREYWPDEDP
jgi:hypothetical protein